MEKENIFFCGEKKNGEGKGGKYQTKYTVHQMSRKVRNHPVGLSVRYKMMNCISDTSWYLLILCQ